MRAAPRINRRRVIARLGAVAVSGARASSAAAFLLLMAPALSEAQCVMCGKNAEYAGGEPGRAYATLAAAALVLLVPTLSVVAGFAAYVWKHRH